MAGIFNIIPKGGTTITCAFGDNESIPYNIVAADFNEVEREEVLYSGGKLGGSVVNINYGIVEITLLFAVGGTSENDAAVNARTLSNALRNRDGGLIEYRPREYDSTVTNTFYRYLKAGASRRISKKTLIPTERHVAGELHEFTVTTFAWATSDPDNFETIVTETRIYNHDDAGHNNYVDILGSDIKGDVFFPIIKYQGDFSPLTFSNRLIVHKRAMRVGAHTNLDWIEGENLNLSGIGTGTRAEASDGEYGIISIFPSTVFDTVFPAWDSTYLGNISTIICARPATAGTASVWNIEFRVLFANAAIAKTVVLDNAVWSGVTEWDVYYQIGELPMPMLDIPRHVTDTSTPKTIEQYVSGHRWNISFERVSGTKELWLDWVLFALADDWINVFNSSDLSINTALSFDGDNQLEIDAISNTSHLRSSTSLGIARDAWESKGSPISSLVFRADEDSRLRFIAPGMATSSYPYNGLIEALVTITGVHATVYPFET